MKTSLLHVILLSSLLVGVCLADDAADVDDACNCDHCLKTTYSNQGSGEIPPVVVPLNKEDVDGDGLLEICARSRDLPDRNFPSVCHMLCHNRCTRFNVTEITEGNFKRHITTAYRNNYYKLLDGPCKKT